jgi:hypothetical protein
MAVTLTRMEGKLDSVNEKVTDLRAEVTQHRADIVGLKSVTQQLQSDMRGAEDARLAAIAAVKADADARLAIVNAQAFTSAQKWTPWQRFFVILGATVGALGSMTAVVYYLLLMKH